MRIEIIPIINNKPTVVHVVTSLDFGGVEKHMELISEELPAAGMNHVFVAIGSGGETAATLSKNGAEVICLNQSVRIPSFYAVTSLIRILNRYRPLAVHTHGAEANFHGLIAGWLANVPVRIGEEIGMPGHSEKAKFVFRLIYGLAHRVIGVSAVVSAWLESNNEVPLSKSICMNCPARLPQARTHLDPELNKKFRVSFVGRLEPVKNPLVLIPIAIKLLSLGIPLEILVIGEGSQRPDLEREIEKHNLLASVKLMGFQSDPAEFLRRSSVYVLPSFSEGFGLSLVEAMGCGVPVIVPRIGSAPELVETGASGWLLEDNSAEAFSEGLLQAWEAGSERLFEMGRRARLTVEGRFEPARYVSDLEKLYLQVAGECGERGAFWMRKLRVLHCLETVGSGGVEQRRLLLARGLDRERYEQALVCTQAIGELPAEFARAGCSVHEIGVFRNILDWERYAKAFAVVREFNPDIIHGAVYEGVATAATVGTRARTPIIIGEETDDPVGRRRWRGHLLSCGLASLTHRMVAVSPSVENYLVRYIKLPASKVTLINNGAAEPAPATEEQKRGAREALRIQPDDLIVGCCCRLFDEHKRVSDLIKAFARVHEYYPKSKLLIVGEGPDEAMLRSLADQLGASENICFAGYQGNTRPFYEIMDIFALASSREAFGLVLVEAMYARLPVVATCVGGIPTVVKAGETGFLVKPKNPEEFADRLRLLLDDVSLRRSMGKAGLAYARAHFSEDRYVRQVDELYQGLAEQQIGFGLNQA